jgi:hypothetical protein
MLVPNENLRNVLDLMGMIAAPICDFVVTEKGTLGRMLHVSPSFLPCTSKDIQGIQIDPLNSVVNPDDEIQMGKCCANSVILSVDLGNHIITHQNDDVPWPIHLRHVGVAGFNFGLIGTAADLLPGHFGKIRFSERLHGTVIRITGHQNAQLFGMGCHGNPFLKGGLKLSRSLPGRTLQ